MEAAGALFGPGGFLWMLHLGVLIATCVASAASPIKLAAPPLSTANVNKELADFLSEDLAQQLTNQGIRVVTAQEIAALVGVERQRQLLGCNDKEQSSCMAELGGALGADGVLTGSVGKFEDLYRVNLKITSSDGQLLASHSETVEGGEKKLIQAMGVAAQSLAQQLRLALHREEPPAPVEPETPSRFLRASVLVPLIGGAVVAGGGAFLVSASNAEVKKLQTGSNLSEKEIDNHANTASFERVGGWAAVGLGAAAVISAVVIATVSDPGEPSTSTNVAISAGPGGVSLRGAF